jgi:MGT family glycosyltransferase
LAAGLLDDPPMSGAGKTIVFFPEGAFGPTNNCVGIGDVLRRRGHRVVFIVEESFAGTLETQGFEERLMRLTPPPETEEAPGQFWKDFIRDTAPVFRKSTQEQLAEFIAPTFQALIDGARYVDDRLLEIVDELQPDLIVEDNVVAFPALIACGRPWARIVSCNPTEVKDPKVPPPFSGLPSGDRGGWEEYWVAYRETHREMHASFSEFCQERGAPPLPADDFIHESPWLNMYLYPDEVDYRRAYPLGETWHNLQASVRATDPAWEVPEKLRDGEGPLLYLSLGSLGSADVALMEKLVAELAGAPYRIVVSKGPQAAEFDLADNMDGAEFLPQTEILPKVDLVITHGGNNTVTESLYFGKPMVLLPIFWDQHDNAQRVHETGFGERLPTYSFTDEEISRAIDGLVGEDALHAKLGEISKRLQANPGNVRAADLIERLAETGEPVTD